MGTHRPDFEASKFEVWKVESAFLAHIQSFKVEN